jgi:hypothetical protein
MVADRQVFRERALLRHSITTRSALSRFVASKDHPDHFEELSRLSGSLGVLWPGLCLSGVALPSTVQSFDPAGLPYLVATGLIHAAHGSIARGGVG